MRKSLAMAVFAAIFLVGCSGASAVVRPGDEGGEGQEPRYAQDRVVVKLREDAAARVRQAWEQWGELTPDRLPFESLRSTSERNNVARWEPLIPDVREDDAGGLGRTYVLTLSGPEDVLRVVQDFSGLSDLVEYAEPDHTAHIQE